MNTTLNQRNYQSNGQETVRNYQSVDRIWSQESVVQPNTIKVDWLNSLRRKYEQVCVPWLLHLYSQQIGDNGLSMSAPNRGWTLKLQLNQRVHNLNRSIWKPPALFWQDSQSQSGLVRQCTSWTYLVSFVIYIFYMNIMRLKSLYKPTFAKRQKFHVHFIHFM